MTGVPASAAGNHRSAPAAPAAVARRPSLWNIANVLTMVRLLLVPGFVVLLLHGDGHDPAWRSFAWAAFAIAMITDLFDGELARRYGLVTDFGKIADPIADKAIMGAALIGLSALGDLPWWVTAVILFRELGITLMRFWVIRWGVIPASRGGKLKTLTQGVAVGMYILILTGPLATLRAVLMGAAVVLTVVTGMDYVRQAVVMRRAGLAAQRTAAAHRAREGADRPEEELTEGRPPEYPEEQALRDGQGQPEGQPEEQGQGA
ncbi:CDP-diacylglycerol--glycerol-3-phosphate 3-phosphatidyltransferase [Streptomyces sp. NPDC026673]|uniref:CDP-diacylglycerol--glycerol-3-phosphate 3-phosphatidyltransferase n=1 Tax=Streptomyces sp. NPDC026673 TaxID=3155724 RepID=UPI0033DD900C